MPILIILLGLLALLIAWLILYRSQFFFRLNDFMRRHVFSDQLVLFQGRRMAVLLMSLGIVALFSGIDLVTENQPIKPRIAGEMIVQARADLGGRRFQNVIVRCKELIRSDPKNVEAWDLLAHAWWALGNKELAANAAESLLRINPNHPIRNSSIGEFVRARGKR